MKRLTRINSIGGGGGAGTVGAGGAGPGGGGGQDGGDGGDGRDGRDGRSGRRPTSPGRPDSRDELTRGEAGRGGAGRGDAARGEPTPRSGGVGLPTGEGEVSVQQQRASLRRRLEELEGVFRFMGKGHPDYELRRQEIEQLRAMLESMTPGGGGS